MKKYDLKKWELWRVEKAVPNHVAAWLYEMELVDKDDYRDFHSILKWVASFCQEHPSEAEVLGRMIKNLMEESDDRLDYVFTKLLRELKVIARSYLPEEKKEVIEELKAAGCEVEAEGQYNESLSIPEGIRMVFPGKKIVVTGASERASRNEFKAFIEQAGGVFTDTVSTQTDYLVVCNKRSTGWLFSLFGRKVQLAAECGVCLVREDDFWASLEA